MTGHSYLHSSAAIKVLECTSTFVHSQALTVWAGLTVAELEKGWGPETAAGRQEQHKPGL